MNNRLKIKDIKKLLENYDENMEIEQFSLHTENRFIDLFDGDDGFDCKVGEIEERISLKAGDEVYDAFHKARNILNDNDNHEFWNDFYIEVYGNFNLYTDKKHRENGLIANIMVENGTCDIDRVLYKKYDYKDDFINLR